MNTKKVIDIYDYDYTLKAWVGNNKLMWSISVTGDYQIISLARERCKKQHTCLALGKDNFSSNVHFYAFYSLYVFYVLQQTRACKNFENPMYTKKVIQIYDYDYTSDPIPDYTQKALVEYNKLVQL